MEEYLIVSVDIGGTKILSALISPENEIIIEKRIKTPLNNLDKLILDVDDLLKSLFKETDTDFQSILGVGISIAGTVDYNRGYLFRAPNIGLSDINLAKIISEKLDYPVFIDNDANLACLGEYLYGAGQGADNLVCLTFGTGIGGGIIINGQLYRGSCGSAGELGHSVIQIEGPECSCRRLGCYEEIASGRALGRLAADMAKEIDKSLVEEVLAGGTKITGEMIGKAAEQDRLFAKMVVEEYANYVSIGVINYVNIFNPDKVILGGGVMDSGQEILNVVKKRVLDEALPPNNSCAEIVKANLGSNAGILGAAGLVRMALNKEVK